jgi:hypothetical protein
VYFQRLDSSITGLILENIINLGEMAQNLGSLCNTGWEKQVIEGGICCIEKVLGCTTLYNQLILILLNAAC